MGAMKHIVSNIIDRNLKATAMVTGYELDDLYEFFEENIDDGLDWDDALNDVVETALELDYYEVEAPADHYSFKVGMELFRKAGGIFTCTLEELFAN